MGDCIHHGEAHRLAEEGSFAASVPTLPVLQYFPCRGRAEPIRLVLSYARQPWFEPPPASVRQICSIMHGEFDGYPFRQLPRFIDDELNGEADFVQSGAILRHLGRKHDLYGKGLVEAGRIDMVLDAVSELRAKIRAVVVERRSEAAALQEYLGGVMAPEEELKGLGMMGPGLASLEYLLARRRYSDGGWLVGAGPSLADFAAFDLVDLHLAQSQLAEPLRNRFPALIAHHAKVAELHGVAEYLASDTRHAALFAADWLREHGAPPPPA
ncbi:Glutathione S-transferase P [Pleodorina starrii]|nr:Glutathione S-transferase P [Pleodorina starrii]